MWKCTNCGKMNAGAFCGGCGSPRPRPDPGREFSRTAGGEGWSLREVLIHAATLFGVMILLFALLYKVDSMLGSLGASLLGTVGFDMEFSLSGLTWGDYGQYLLKLCREYMQYCDDAEVKEAIFGIWAARLLVLALYAAMLGAVASFFTKDRRLTKTMRVLRIIAAAVGLVLTCAVIYVNSKIGYSLIRYSFLPGLLLVGAAIFLDYKPALLPRVLYSLGGNIPQPWICNDPYCRAVNMPGTQFCVKCGKRRDTVTSPPPPPPPPPPPATWQCGNCGVENYSSAYRCARCGYTRDGGEDGTDHFFKKPEM